MEDYEEYGKLTKQMSDLIHHFIEGETTAEERQRIFAELQKHPGPFVNALFNVIGWAYEFEMEEKPFTLEYKTTYTLELHKSEYELNLYSGQGDDKKQIKQIIDRDKRKTFTKFLIMIDAVKKGNFKTEN